MSTPFTQTPLWAYELDVSHTAFRLYSALLIFVDSKTRTCYPSKSEIIKRAKISKNTYQSAIDELKATGAIQVTERPGYTNLIYLPWEGPIEKPNIPTPKIGTPPTPKIGTRTISKELYSNNYIHPTNQSNVVGRREEETTPAVSDGRMDGILKNYNEEEIRAALNQMHETSNTNNRDKERTALNDLLNEGWTLDEIKQCWRVASKSHIENSSERKYWKNLYKWLSGKNKDKTDSARYTLNASKNASNAPKIDANQKNGYKYPETIKHDKCGTESTLEIEAAGGYRCEKCHAVFFPFKKSD